MRNRGKKEMPFTVQYMEIYFFKKERMRIGNLQVLTTNEFQSLKKKRAKIDIVLDGMSKFTWSESKKEK